MSLWRGPNDGTLAVRCHAAGCSLSGDIFSLLGAIHRLDPRDCDDFKRLLDIGDALVGAGPSDGAAPRLRRIGRVRCEPEPVYPPASQVKAVMAKCGPCADDRQVCDWLRGRGLDPGEIDRAELAYALPDGARGLPRWAAFWPNCGCRLIVPTYDSSGGVVSLRARNVAGKEPKARAPGATKGAFSTRGLVVASPGAVALLQGKDHAPRMVVLVEGEPDALALAGVPANDVAVFGIVAGDSWTPSLGRKIWGCEVVIATDDDRGGDAHAQAILGTIAGRCLVRDLFASGRAARRSGLSWPSAWDLNELLLDGADLLKLLREAEVILTPESAPFLAQEPANDGPGAGGGPEPQLAPPEAVQRAVERALERLRGREFLGSTSPQLAVLGVVIRRAWWRRVPGPSGQQVGESFPSLDTIAVEAGGLDVKTVRRALEALKREGHLEVVRRCSDDGQRDITHLFRLRGVILSAGMGEEQ